MSDCQTHIVECLRNNNIYPTASSSSVYDQRYLASNALEYSTSNQFTSLYGSIGEWWIVDFKTIVNIDKYSIKTSSGSGWIYNWDSEISNDNITWTKVHEGRNTICSDQLFELDSSFSCKYFKIIGIGQTTGEYLPGLAFFYVKCFGSIHSSSAYSSIIFNPFIYYYSCYSLSFSIVFLLILIS